MEYRFAWERNADELPPPALLQAMAGIGFTGCRLMTSLVPVNPERGIWAWHSTDECIRRLRAAGIGTIQLNVFGFPAHACEGRITYHKYTAGPWVYDVDANGDAIAGTAKFNGDLPWVKDPGHVDPAWVKTAAKKLVTRYFVAPIQRGGQPVIQEVSVGNEMDDGTYWPPVFALAPHFEQAFQRFESEVLLPFLEGIDEACAPIAPRRPLVTGPETAYSGGLDSMLSLGSASAFDRVSFHAYSENGQLDGALRVLDERLPILERHRGGRPAGIGEINDSNNGWIFDYLPQLQQRAPQISWIVLYANEQWFTPPSWNDQTFQRNAKGDRLRETIARQ
jgi:hypothetical protein